MIDYDLENWATLDYINGSFIAYNWVHLASAFMYMLAWKQYGFGFFSVVQIPEVGHSVAVAVSTLPVIHIVCLVCGGGLPK